MPAKTPAMSGGDGDGGGDDDGWNGDGGDLKPNTTKSAERVYQRPCF